MVITSLDALAAEAERFVTSLTPNEHTATLVTLSGELGAGKTAFTKAVAKALGVGEMVNSPTFVLEKIYKLPGGSLFKHLIHIDAYRLLGGKDLAPLGFDEIMQDPANLVLLEWPEKVPDGLPTPTHRLVFKVLAENERTITYG